MSLLKRRTIAATALIAALVSVFGPAITHEAEYLPVGWAIFTEGPAPIFVLTYLAYVAALVACVAAVSGLARIFRELLRWASRNARR